MQKPSLGRIVIAFVDPIGNNGAQECPAVITRVWGQRPDGAWTVNIKTIKDGNVDEWKTSVALFGTEGEALDHSATHSCYWPPRV